MSKSWTRRWTGWWSPNREVYLERGPRMTDGGTAWLIWIKADDAEVEPDDWGAMPRYEIFGNVGCAPARRASEVSLDARDGSAWYVQTNDAGSLAEAKLTAFGTIAHLNARRAKLIKGKS